MSVTSPGFEQAPVSAEPAGVLVRRVALIAVMAIAVGFAFQIAILAIKLAGGATPKTVTIFADLAQGITWSLLVCVGVGIATTVGRARPMLAGLLSFIVAPAAVALAKFSQKVMAGLLSAVEQQAALSLGAISSLKAVEYGALGWLLARLVQKSESRAARYFGVGGLIGVTFGALIAWLAYQAALTKGLQPSSVQITVSLINEMLFPVACAGVIYAGQLVGRSLRAIESRNAMP